MTEHLNIEAACRCGAVQFRSHGAPVAQFICHCADCRSATGDPCTSTAFFKRSEAKWNEPSGQLTYIAASGSTTYREMCLGCGTVMFDTSDKFPDLIGVVSQWIKPPFFPKPSHHMWVDSKVGNLVIKDTLPRTPRGVFDG